MLVSFSCSDHSGRIAWAWAETATQKVSSIVTLQPRVHSKRMTRFRLRDALPCALLAGPDSINSFISQSSLGLADPIQAPHNIRSVPNIIRFGSRMAP